MLEIIGFFVVMFGGLGCVCFALYMSYVCAAFRTPLPVVGWILLIGGIALLYVSYTLSPFVITFTGN